MITYNKKYYSTVPVTVSEWSEFFEELSDPQLEVRVVGTNNSFPAYNPTQQIETLYTMELVPVTEIKDVETLRTVRNECRMFMTRNQNELSVMDQAKWWGTLDTSKYQPFLVVNRWGFAEGFAAMAYEDDTVWVTAGLLPSSRGKGLGRAVFEELIRRARVQGYKRVMLDVLKTNIPAKNLYVKLGFTLTDETPTTLVMCRDL